MIAVAVPPAPEINWAATLGLSAGAIVVGLAALLWGRVIGRAMLMLAGAVGGFALSAHILPYAPNYPMLVKFGCTAGLAIVGLALARLIWAILGSSLFSGIACAALLGKPLLKLWKDVKPTFDSLAASGQMPTQEQVTTLSKAADAATQNVTLMVWLSILFIGLIPLVVGLLRPRLMTIFMTALLGGMAITGGLLGALIRYKPSVWDAAWAYWPVPLGLTVVLMTVGMVFQYHGALAADKKDDKREGAAPSDKPKPDEKPVAKKDAK